MDFRERTKLKIAISQMKDEEKAMNKNNSLNLKRGIGIAACFAIMFSGIVYAKDIENYIRKLFNNSNEAIDVAVEEGYVQTEKEEYTYDKGIGIKVENLILDDLNLNVSFMVESKIDNIKSICLKDFDITNDNDKVVFRSEFKYSETLEELPLYNSLDWANEPIKVSDTTYSDSILLGLRPEKEDFKELYFKVKSFQVTYIDDSQDIIEGSWDFNVAISEAMRKNVNIEYKLSENNNYVENCTGTLSPTGMVVELKLYQEFDPAKYIEDNLDKLDDTGIFYIKYNNELLLPSLLEKGNTDGDKFVIHYDNIGLFFDNINEIELYLLPFDTTIKLIEKSN